MIAAAIEAPTARERTLRLLRRLFVAVVWISAGAFWLALAVGYVLDASPLSTFELSMRWSRPAGSPAPSHRAQGELRLGH